MSKTTEHQAQSALMIWANLQSGTCPELKLLFAIPNGGQRNIVTAAKLKREGVKAGVPDLFLPVARKGFHGLFLEMKTRKGRTTGKQDLWIVDLRIEGYIVTVCHGSDEAIKKIKWYLEI